MSAIRSFIPANDAQPVLIAEHEFVRRRIQRAIRSRERYRYVVPEVQVSDGVWTISSPCCSRNIDAQGGMIDIARVERADGAWLLYWRDHKQGLWQLYEPFPTLDELLQVVCIDSQRLFWP